MLSATFYADLRVLINAKRGYNESLRNFESRFESTFFRFSAYSEDISIFKLLLVLILLSVACVDGIQSFLAASIGSISSAQLVFYLQSIQTSSWIADTENESALHEST